MGLSDAIMALCLLFITNVVAQWSVPKISSIGIFSPNSTGTISFIAQRGTVQTNCALTWTTPTIPKPWNKCDDPMLRWRISNYTDVSSLSIEIVQLALVTTPPSISILRTNFTTNPGKGSQVCGPIANSLTNCTSWSPNVPAPTSLTFTPSPLSVTWSLMRTDGASSGVIPCTAASTFYLSDPNVALLGPLTLGKGSLQPIWKTTCNTYWSCYPPSADPSIDTWTGCTAPAFQIKKTLPASGGNMYSNFVLSITHTFPLMMATSVRGNNAWDRLYSDPEEAPGMDVVLTLANTPFKDGSSYFAQIIQGGIDQTGNCATGCEYGGGQVAINVASITIV